MGVESGDLSGGEGTTGWITRDFVKMFRTGRRSKWLGALRRGRGIVCSMVTHKGLVVQCLPVDTIGGNVIDRFRSNVHPSRPMSNHAKHKELAWTSGTFTSNVQRMCVPALGPLLSVFIDGMEKEMVQEPEVFSAVRI
ncbi:hypothetical protein L226DRAFT_524448 [Lentinus tigrinus ALCF2SS1-7]|uniref:uncharacterized protein n=1 Tax=Lentinus tigrinus ALCF2SS1-7 TaxID=1328758 RepID=UPI00116616F1|nr:hypothetical protein L226DRAFT_524448 [Lentinus tigrinus ALCF2SS1-7]